MLWWYLPSPGGAGRAGWGQPELWMCPRRAHWWFGGSLRWQHFWSERVASLSARCILWISPCTHYWRLNVRLYGINDNICITITVDFYLLHLILPITWCYTWYQMVSRLGWCWPLEGSGSEWGWLSLGSSGAVWTLSPWGGCPSVLPHGRNMLSPVKGFRHNRIKKTRNGITCG